MPQYGFDILIDKSFSFASWIFDPFQFILLLIVTSFIFYIKYGFKDFSFFIRTLLFSVILAWLIKYLFNIERPIGSEDIFGPSFPSAHSTIATAYFLTLLHYFKRDEDKWRRILHYFFCISFVLIVGVSRLYLGVHFLSDVLAGYLFGGLVVYIMLKLKNA